MGKVSVVEESNIGVYLWEYEKGKCLADDQGNFMHITSAKGDRVRLEKLENAAKRYLAEAGYEFGGKPKFIAGARPVTEEELEEQKERMKSGLIPDPLDIAAMNEHLANERKYGTR